MATNDLDKLFKAFLLVPGLIQCQLQNKTKLEVETFTFALCICKRILYEYFSVRVDYDWLYGHICHLLKDDV